jgi:transcriptional regulator with XRE-family HTH domain
MAPRIRKARRVRILKTEGRLLLKALVEVDGVGQSDVARALKIRPSNVSLWCSGRSRPEHHLREALELRYKIPRESWMTANERAVVDQARMASDPAR